MCYFAAAVSDFYIPSSEIAEHKIQSGKLSEGLDIHLKPVPKMLGEVRTFMCPEARLISFKLETDPGILEQKASTARERYGMDFVVANLLETRMTEATIYGAEGGTHLKIKEGECLEELIVDFLSKA